MVWDQSLLIASLSPVLGVDKYESKDRREPSIISCRRNVTKNRDSEGHTILA